MRKLHMEINHSGNIEHHPLTKEGGLMILGKTGG